jgi:hypothetical protein
MSVGCRSDSSPRCSDEEASGHHWPHSWWFSRGHRPDRRLGFRGIVVVELLRICSTFSLSLLLAFDTKLRRLFTLLLALCDTKQQRLFTTSLWYENVTPFYSFTSLWYQNAMPFYSFTSLWYKNAVPFYSFTSFMQYESATACKFWNKLLRPSSTSNIHIYTTRNHPSSVLQRGSQTWQHIRLRRN